MNSAAAPIFNYEDSTFEVSSTTRRIPMPTEMKTAQNPPQIAVSMFKTIWPVGIIELGY